MAPTHSRSASTSTSTALIVLPPSALVPASFFASCDFSRHMRVLVHNHRVLHDCQIVPYQAQRTVLASSLRPLSVRRGPLLLLPPASPPRAVRAVKADHCTLALCFRFLDVQSLLACRRVSRLWLRQSRMRLVGEGRCWPEQRDKGRRGEGPAKMHKAPVDNAYVRALCHSLPFLQSLDLRKADKLGRSDGISEKALSSIAHLSSSLTSLTLTHYATAVTDRSVLHLTRLRRLRTLNLSACRSLTSQALHYLHDAPMSRTLTALDVSSCGRIGDVSYLRVFPHLTTLNLSECRRLVPSSLSSLAGLPLTALSVQSTHVSAASLAFLTEGTSALSSLDCSACPDMDDAFAAILPHLRALKVLKLADCPALSPDFLPAAASAMSSPLTSLRCLDLSKLPAVVTDASLPFLASICPALQILHLSQCSEFTTTASLAALPALHSLSLNLCHSLRSLASLPSLPLVKLSLWDCALIGDAELLALMTCEWLVDVNVCSCRVGEDSVRAWVEGGMRRLRRLCLRFCTISEDARVELRDARRDCLVID